MSKSGMNSRDGDLACRCRHHLQPTHLSITSINGTNNYSSVVAAAITPRFPATQCSVRVVSMACSQR